MAFQVVQENLELDFTNLAASAVQYVELIAALPISGAVSASLAVRVHSVGAGIANGSITIQVFGTWPYDRDNTTYLTGSTLASVVVGSSSAVGDLSLALVAFTSGQPPALRIVAKGSQHSSVPNALKATLSIGINTVTA